MLSISEEDKTFLNWLTSLPVVPSHYCRSAPTYQDKRFLEPGTTIVNLYQEYKKASEESGRRSACSKIFSKTFRELNFSVFSKRGNGKR
jgi:hypothetical protein